MLQRSLTRVENFLIKVPFATEWEVLPADRPKERDRPTGHVRPERGTSAAAYQMQSKRLGNSHDRPCCSAASRQRNIFVGVQITSRTLRARRDGCRLASPVGVNLFGWPNNAGEDRAFRNVSCNLNYAHRRAAYLERLEVRVPYIHGNMPSNHNVVASANGSLNFGNGTD